MSAKVDPLVCVDLMFWRELNKWFLYFSPRVSFSQCCAFFPLLCFAGWKKLIFAHYQRVVQFWHQFCQGIGTWKSYADSSCVGSWNAMHPFFVATLQCLLLVCCDIFNWVEGTGCHHGGQYFNLYSQCFYHINCRKGRLSFEYFEWKLGITCNIIAVFWLLNRFPKKRIWKTKSYFFCKSLSKKKHYVTMSKKRKKLLMWKLHLKLTIYGNILW